MHGAKAISDKYVLSIFTKGGYSSMKFNSNRKLIPDCWRSYRESTLASVYPSFKNKNTTRDMKVDIERLTVNQSYLVAAVAIRGAGSGLISGGSTKHPWACSLHCICVDCHPRGSVDVARHPHWGAGCHRGAYNVIRTRESKKTRYEKNIHIYIHSNTVYHFLF